jgi:PIN domain nuclease of toxin-antitoxin system
MKLLLDTHAFIWSILEPEKLPATVTSTVEDSTSEVFVSAISLWEIAIKTRINKIHLIDLSTDELIPSAKKMGFQLIPLTPDEAVTQGKLAEDTHFDPFDRMLIWQAISRKLTLISSDSKFERFVSDGLKLLWK